MPSAPPYKVYRSGPRGLRARLRGDDDLVMAGGPGDDGRRNYRTSRGWAGGGRTPKRVLLAVLGFIVFWLLLSLVLFMLSTGANSPPLPAGAGSQLTSGGPMVTSANTVLLLGLDTRPKTGPGSKEPGANFNDAHAATDTIMLWRIGGGTSRRLSIPRDTLVHIPGVGMSKINAAWAVGGPAMTLKVVKEFTGLQINHLIVINLGNFPKFIDDIGGVTVKTGHVCSNISGGVKNGGFTLNLSPGVHHLNGTDAMVLARTRENPCDPKSNDLTREAAQQQIVNSVKSQIVSLHTFVHLPWAAWDAPGVFETDMGGITLMQMAVASEIGGSAPPSLLSETPSVYNGADVLVPNRGNVQSQVQKLLNG